MASSAAHRATGGRGLGIDAGIDEVRKQRQQVDGAERAASKGAGGEDAVQMLHLAPVALAAADGGAGRREGRAEQAESNRTRAKPR
ncbi:MAG: hypothetical protein AB7L91_15925 [Dehalococcoidia bacterium]